MRNHKQKGILTGANFSLKKVNRKLRRMVEAAEPTIQLLANGLPDFTAKCKENSPYNPENRKYAKLARGQQIIEGLIGRFKV